jgi:L-ascorbate metabolism protein UlaG (beta-lactamase superfamily)
MKKIAPLLVVVAVLLAACGQPAKTAEPSPTPKPAGVILTYEDNAQFELVTPTGRHIYIDVVNPALFTQQPTANDILLTTHLHTDHYYRDFAEAFPGQQLIETTGKIELPDVTITSIAAGHNSSDPLLEKNGTDYIYLIEIGGLRIAHFGDIGQDALTADQLSALGKVDVAITQFDNSFSTMNATNMKGFNLMDQLQPHLVIPTAHVTIPTMKIAFERWTGYYSEDRTVTITPDNLPTGTGILALGNMAAAYNSLYSLKAWK